MESLKMTKYKKSLVIGKFMPPHKGHENLITHASKNSHNVDVVVLGHDEEVIPLDLRYKWLTEHYELVNPHVHIKELTYDPNVLESSSESNINASIKWSDYLKEQNLLEGVDVIVGSEMYVKYMADYIGIDYIIFDIERKNINISATEIRNNIFANWNYLLPPVKRRYAKHVCVCGSESTGKTTICNNLDKNDYVTLIPEIGRCVVGNSKCCDLYDLKTILKIHTQLLDAVKDNPPSPIIVWDTDNVITLSYINFLFGEDYYNYDVVKADKYFFLESNVKHVQDNTRLESYESKMLSKSHKETYEKFNIDLECITYDSYEKRYLTIKHYIDILILELHTRLFKH